MEPRFIRMREEAAAIGVLSSSPLTSQGLDALVEVCGHFMVYTKAPRLDALVPRLESEVAVFMDAQPGHLGVNFDVDEAELLTTLHRLDDAEDQQLTDMLRNRCAARC